MSGGSSSTERWTVPAEFQSIVNKATTSAMTAFDQTPTTPYTGPYNVKPNQTQKDAVAATVARAPQLSMGASGIRDYAGTLLAGDWLKPETNPYLSGMAEAATRGATDNFNRSVLPNLRSAAISQGAYGGSREGVETAVRAAEVDKNIRDTYANIYGNNYAREREFMSQVPGLYGAANELDLATPKALSAAGDQTYAWDQMLADEDLAKYMEAIAAPWRGVDKVSGIVNQLMGGAGNTTTTQKTPWYQQALQAGMGGLGFLLAM